MWPFEKAEPEKLPYETICTICLERYPPGVLLAQYPVCSDCASEGMDIFTEKFDDYIASKSASYFDDMLKWWEAKEGFLPEFKALKTQRILALRALVVSNS